MSVTFSIAGKNNEAPDFCNNECEYGDCAKCEAAAAWMAKNEVNMANGNAADVLTYLGIAFDECLCGAIKGTELLKLCAAALSRPADKGYADRQEGNMIECGRRDGYIHERVAQLKALAEQAGTLGRIVFG